jgi:hypothetical protein
MNVEKRHAITFAEKFALDVEEFAADLLQASDRNVPRDQGVRHAGESTLLQVNVSSTNFRQFYCEQRGVQFEIRFDDLTYFDRAVWGWDYGDEWHCGKDKVLSRKGAKAQRDQDFLCAFAPLRGDTV